MISYKLSSKLGLTGYLDPFDHLQLGFACCEVTSPLYRTLSLMSSYTTNKNIYTQTHYNTYKKALVSYFHQEHVLFLCFNFFIVTFFCFFYYSLKYIIVRNNKIYYCKCMISSYIRICCCRRALVTCNYRFF